MKKQTYKKLFTVATASAMAAGAVVAVAPAQADAAKSFSDVSVNNGHYENIMNLTERKVITGYEDGTYRPNASIKRGNAAKIIAGVLGLDTTNVTNPGFSDVSVNNSNYGAIAALANAGIINGYEGKYNPNGTLTRGQMAKIISNAFKLTGGEDVVFPFTDVKPQYKADIANLVANKVTTGTTSTTFSEGNFVTRGQLASFVVRAEQAVAGGETPGEETPGSTSTVEKAVTVLNVTNNLVTINGEQFEIASEVAGVFNTVNAEALKDAETTLVIEYPLEPTASVANVAKKGKIVGVKSLKLVKSGTSFDAKGYTIPALTVAADNVTVANTVSTTLDVAANNKVTLNGVTATTLTVGKGAKITLGEGFKFTTIKLASGDKIENVITNYAAVKDALKDTKVEQSSGGGGGGGGSTTKVPPSEVINNAKDQINNDLKDLTIGSAFFDGSKLTITLTSADTGYTVADAWEDKDVLFAAIAESNVLDAVDTVTLPGVGTYTVEAAKKLSNLERALILVKFLGLPNEDLESLLKDPDQDLTKFLQNSSKTVTVKYDNGATKAYPVNIVK